MIAGQQSGQKRRKLDLGYQPRRQFLRFHARTERWACLVCHRRAGKTVACIMDLVDAALRCKHEEGRFAYLAPTYAQAKDNSWSYLKRFTADIGGVEQRESDLMVTVPNAWRDPDDQPAIDGNAWQVADTPLRRRDVRTAARFVRRWDGD